MRFSEAKSSLVKELSYDSKTRTMIVTYREDNARFAYSGVSQGLFDTLKRSSYPVTKWAAIRSSYPHKRV